MSVVFKTGAVITVATSGTEVQMPVIDRVVALYLAAPAANTGIMYAGDTTVAVATGIPIVKSTAPVVIMAPEGHFIDMQSIWVDAATSGDKLVYSYLQKTN
jgi:hypothetical protein